MKFLVVLALVVAVGSAAFTGSLVDQARPMVNMIKADLSQGLKARSSAEVGLQNAFLESLQSYINGILEQIQGSLGELEGNAGQIVDLITGAVGQLQGLIGSIGSHTGGGLIGGVIEHIQNVISGLIGQLVGGQKKNRANFELSEELLQMIHSVLESDTVGHVLDNSELYQCVNHNLIASGESPSGLDLAFALYLNENNLLTPDYLLNSPHVAPCLEAQGGIEQVILNSEIIAQLHGLVVQLGMQEAVTGVLVDLLGPDYASQLLELLSQNNRGFWDIWEGLGDLAQGVWESLSQGAQSLLQILGNIGSHAWASAAEKLAAIRNLVQAHLNNGIQNAQNLGLEAAQALVNTIVPVYEQLGAVGQQAIAQLHSIYDNLQIPQWILNGLGPVINN